MNIRDLDCIFQPRRIALLGVMPNPRSVGGKVLNNLVTGGFQGIVYPVHPTAEAVFGVPCHPDLARLPKQPDLAIICTPPQEVPDLVRQCGKAGIRGVIIMSAGFKETGAAGRELEERIAVERRRFEGMRILGPNCLGFISPVQNLNVSFVSGMPRPGNIAFISQSGALCSSVLDWAIEEKVGFSYFVSIGNTLDVDFGDLIDYFGEDEKTKSIILYIESVTQARKFMSAARAFARTKPIIAYKAGIFPESAEAAASHTGAMASEDAVYEAAFKRAGMARVMDIGELFDCADLIGRGKLSPGPRLGIVTNAGGPGVIATDALMGAGGVLAGLSPASIAQLDEALPPAWSHRNPVDVLGDARSKRIARAVAVLLDDPGVDAVLVILTPQAMTNPTAVARAVGPLAATTAKPILAAWLGGGSMREGIHVLNEQGIATYTTPEQGVRAFMTLVEYSRNLGTLYETPREIPVEFPLDREAARFSAAQVTEAGGRTLSEEASKRVLEAYGIPTTLPKAARDADEAARTAEDIGFPVVLKVRSPDITHKTDVGGVALNLRTETDVRQAFARMMSEVAARAPAAALEGVTVQKMIERGEGVELILGTKKDPTFGTVLMVGSGGVAAELFGDRVLGFPPLNERLARRMLGSLRCWPLLLGYRGKPPMHTAQLVEVLIRLSYLVTDHPEIGELDINPLLVTPEGVHALDARIVPDARPDAGGAGPYAHLALRPYPEEYVRQITLDGIPMVMRPIRPEDEPLWFELLAGCSRESLYTRFRTHVDWNNHAVASRYCFIDYEREVAIVAETRDGERRRLLGIGRMVTEAETDSVEFAILVADDWQNRGLGTTLTEYCLGIARRWGKKRVVAYTNNDNPRMVAVFRKLGFSISQGDDGSTVEVVRTL